MLALADTLAGRIWLMLTAGMIAASMVSLLIAAQSRARDFARIRLESVVASAADVFERTGRDPVRTTQLLRVNQIFGVREAPLAWDLSPPDPTLTGMLVARLGPASRPRGRAMSQQVCFSNWDLSIRAAGLPDRSIPDCWYVRFVDPGGSVQRLAIDVLPFHVPQNATLDPLFLSLTVLAAGLVSFLVAHLATKPLRSLSEAARSFSATMDPELLPERGPAEVRAALHIFNVMQNRIRDGFRERTQILSSVAHDLQTPLTRLRLRVEQVSDEPLRSRLIADLTVTQNLVREGLDLASSAESREPWSVVDIDSILTSLADDAVEFGHAVTVVAHSGAQVRIRPNALIRCLGNLVDNALHYAGDAELSCEAVANDVVIRVRDHGPGIPEARLQEAMEPFRRLSTRSSSLPGGTGIGLPIARAQAQTFGATLTLANHRDGGLVATVRLPAVV